MKMPFIIPRNRQKAVTPSIGLLSSHCLNTVQRVIESEIDFSEMVLLLATTCPDSLSSRSTIVFHFFFGIFHNKNHL